MLGLADNLAYATAKGALIGFTRSLAVAAAPKGILVNSIAPNAVTRPSESTDKPNIVTAAPMDADRLASLETGLVSPMVAYLSHESCTVNGEILVAGARRFSRWFLGITPGWVSDGAPSIEDIASHWSEINDEEGYYAPSSLNDWASRFMSHLAR